MNARPKAAIRFDTAKYEILLPKRPFVFHNKILNSTVVLKQPFVFQSEIRNLELSSNRYSLFDYKIRVF